MLTAVEDAYGNTDAVDDVALKNGAVKTLYADARPRNIEVPNISNPLATVEVPAPCTARFPVVVAPPETVTPPACVPFPKVDDAVEIRPLEKVFVSVNVFGVYVFGIVVDECAKYCADVVEKKYPFASVSVNVWTRASV